MNNVKIFTPTAPSLSLASTLTIRRRPAEQSPGGRSDGGSGTHGRRTLRSPAHPGIEDFSVPKTIHTNEKKGIN